MTGLGVGLGRGGEKAGSRETFVSLVGTWGCLVCCLVSPVARRERKIYPILGTFVDRRK